MVIISLTENHKVDNKGILNIQNLEMGYLKYL